MDDDDDNYVELFSTEILERNKLDLMEVLISILEEEGVEEMNEETLEELNDQLSFVLKMIVQQSIKFADKNNHQSLTAFDIKLGMKSKGVPPMLDFPMDKRNQMDKEVINLEEFVNAPLPKVPLECSLRVECLVKNGLHPLLKNPYESKKPDHIAVLNPRKSLKRKYSEVANFERILAPCLSKEQDEFIEETISSCMGLDDDKRTEALHNLQYNVCLNQMLPNFVIFINRSVRLNAVHQNIARLVFLMRMCKALLDNTTLNLQPFLNEVVSPILTCVLCKNLIWNHNQCTLRDFAISLLRQIFGKFDSNRGIAIRICNVLTAILADSSVPLETQYAAAICLVEMGSDYIVKFILPQMDSISKKIASIIKTSEDSEIDVSSQEADLIVAVQLKNLLLNSLPPVIQKLTDAPGSIQNFQMEFGKFLGSLLHDEVTKHQKHQHFDHSSTL